MRGRVKELSLSSLAPASRPWGAAGQKLGQKQSCAWVQLGFENSLDFVTVSLDSWLPHSLACEDAPSLFILVDFLT